jgi:large subunit ribosomal protein L18
VVGTAQLPRLAVYRSNRFVYAQIIDDENGKTLTSTDSRKVDGKTMMERQERLVLRLQKMRQSWVLKRLFLTEAVLFLWAQLKSLPTAQEKGDLNFNISNRL